jgi:hypothetical protein
MSATDTMDFARKAFRWEGLTFRGGKLHMHLAMIARGEDWPTHSAALAKLKNVDFRINERAGYARRFAEVAENGRVALCRSGMDCDCTQYRTTTHMDVPVSLFAFVRSEHEHERWLDGTESVWFDRLSEQPEMHLSSDRALAAYEDGHSSTVSWADASEMHSA